MSRDNAYLWDILKAAKGIRRFVAGVTQEQFVANEEKHEAVNRKFEIIGEATKRLSPEARAARPASVARVPDWPALSGSPTESRGTAPGCPFRGSGRSTM